MILHLVNIGDAKSLACHPATTTHRQLSEAELVTAGVSANMVRLSIGIEHVDDIIADTQLGRWKRQKDNVNFSANVIDICTESTLSN